MKREEALDVALGQIERQFGKGSVMRMSDRPQVSIGAISTGSLALDMALGIGGLPRGRVVEISKTNKRTADRTRNAAFWAATDLASVSAIVDIEASLVSWAAEALLNSGDGYYGGGGGGGNGTWGNAGGGGSSYTSGACSNVTHTRGVKNAAPGTGETGYLSGTAIGGSNGSDGGSGRVVITW